MESISATTTVNNELGSLNVSWDANIFDTDCSILCQDKPEDTITTKSDLLEQLGHYFYPNEMSETQQLAIHDLSEDRNDDLNEFPELDDLFPVLEDGDQEYLANSSPTCSSGYGSSQSSLSSIDSGELPFVLPQVTNENTRIESRLPPLSTVLCNKMADQSLQFDIDSMTFKKFCNHSQTAESVLEINVPYYLGTQAIPSQQFCQNNESRITTCPTRLSENVKTNINYNTHQNTCTRSEFIDSKKPSRPRKRTANDREKNRTHNVNSAFQKLRTLIPTDPIDRKLSKVETLRLAISYINHLGMTLHSDEWIEQPCLSRRRTNNGEEYLSATEGPVCTFCMSKTKISTKKTSAE